MLIPMPSKRPGGSITSDAFVVAEKLQSSAIRASLIEDRRRCSKIQLWKCDVLESVCNGATIAISSETVECEDADEYRTCSTTHH